MKNKNGCTSDPTGVLTERVNGKRKTPENEKKMHEKCVDIDKKIIIVALIIRSQWAFQISCVLRGIVSLSLGLSHIALTK